ncbi:MAG: REP-associated tyrosine transposase [Acidobacteriaceae bacterium]|nr:REP-associated tyrosine transposase [Acidobacteriaceae bacterium]
MAYLNLLRQNIELHGVGLIGYCLMSNYVHLVVTPHHADGLGLALRQLNCCALDSFRLFTVSSPQIEERPI